MRDLIGNLREKRRAQRLADLLEESDERPQRDGRADHDPELTQLAHVGRALQQAAPSVAAAAQPDADFTADLRRRLMTIAETEGIGVTATKPAVPRQRTRRRFALAAAVAGVVLGLSGVATASGDAVPGDALYPVKRTTERAQVALAGSDVNRGQLYLEFARTRLTEAEVLPADSDALATAISDMDDDTIAGVRALTTAAVEREDAAVLEVIDEFVSEQRPGVVTLMETASGDVRILAGDAVSLLDDVAQRSQELRNTLPCVTVDADVDDLGPVPAQCGAQPNMEDEVVVAPDATEDSTPDGDEETDGRTPGEDESSATESPSPDDSSASPSDDEADEEDEEGGLLSELGDLLSGLLGGLIKR